MNLFDYIKWQGTDICNAQELKSLPTEFIINYWMAINRVLGSKCPSPTNNHDWMCVAIARWNCDRNASEWKIFFLRLLSNYCKENLSNESV